MDIYNQYNTQNVYSTSINEIQKPKLNPRFDIYRQQVNNSITNLAMLNQTFMTKFDYFSKAATALAKMSSSQAGSAGVRAREFLPNLSGLFSSEQLYVDERTLNRFQKEAEFSFELMGLLQEQLGEGNWEDGNLEKMLFDIAQGNSKIDFNNFHSEIENITRKYPGTKLGESIEKVLDEHIKLSQAYGNLVEATPGNLKGKTLELWGIENDIEKAEKYREGIKAPRASKAPSPLGHNEIQAIEIRDNLKDLRDQFLVKGNFSAPEQYEYQNKSQILNKKYEQYLDNTETQRFIGQLISPRTLDKALHGEPIQASDIAWDAAGLLLAGKVIQATKKLSHASRAMALSGPEVNSARFWLSTAGYLGVASGAASSIQASNLIANGEMEKGVALGIFGVFSAIGGNKIRQTINRYSPYIDPNLRRPSITRETIANLDDYRGNLLRPDQNRPGRRYPNPSPNNPRGNVLTRPDPVTDHRFREPTPSRAPGANSNTAILYGLYANSVVNPSVTESKTLSDREIRAIQNFIQKESQTTNENSNPLSSNQDWQKAIQIFETLKAETQNSQIVETIPPEHVDYEQLIEEHEKTFKKVQKILLENPELIRHINTILQEVFRNPAQLRQLNQENGKIEDFFNDLIKNLRERPNDVHKVVREAFEDLRIKESQAILKASSSNSSKNRSSNYRDRNNPIDNAVEYLLTKLFIDRAPDVNESNRGRTWTERILKILDREDLLSKMRIRQLLTEKPLTGMDEIINRHLFLGGDSYDLFIMHLDILNENFDTAYGRRANQIINDVSDFKQLMLSQEVRPSDMRTFIDNLRKKVKNMDPNLRLNL